MNRRVVLYARVSLQQQDADDKVSIDQQLAEMRARCQRHDWEIANVFVDRENYRATQAPSKGKMVNPSGERADRPAFLTMLDHIKTGEPDMVLCWRDDRLVRHPRVAVALEDALDLGDARRNGQTKIQIRDATGAIIDRFTLSIKATIWREENKRRAERGKMGKVATLQQGRWPSSFGRWGYQSIKEPGKRGRAIVENPDTAPIVRRIFEMYDAGTNIAEIRKHLIANGVPQMYPTRCKHDWSMPLIYAILRSPEYLGKATWRFGDGTSMTIDIPQIIDADLWQRVQGRMDRNKVLSRRNAKGIYLLQGLIHCGHCGGQLGVQRYRRVKSSEGYYYRCNTANQHPHEPHSHPHSRNGPKLDWEVWRHLVDCGIKRPDLIVTQVRDRRAELLAEGESADGEIAQVRHRLAMIDQERAFYQRQAARGMISEAEFDQRMEETETARQYCQSELTRLQELRDDAAKVDAGLAYATELMTTLQETLPAIDQQPDELEALPDDERREVMATRQKIIRALCESIHVYADGHVRIEGVLDGSEAAQFDLPDY